MCHVQIHCENAEALIDAQQRTFDAGFTGPEGHYISRPAVLEVRLDVASCMLKIDFHLLHGPQQLCGVSNSLPASGMCT